jgi:hypothetical protein
MKNTKKTKKKFIVYKLGEKFFVEGVLCEVRYINSGTAYLCPTFNDPDNVQIAKHIAYAKMDKNGKVALL